ncbi:response regulator transcription factor [Actinophytocola sp.]|uniref:helix-turn-helix transcriptional regulator n=1 Tax=Actinophytocola sp. TaxID=1872138 RepID=UPI003899D857
MGSSRDRLVRSLDVLAVAATARDRTAFANAVIPTLLELIPGDSAAYCEFLPRERHPGHVLVSIGESVSHDMYECLLRHQGDDPWMRHARRTGDITVRRWSDHTTAKTLDRNPLYHGLYGVVRTRYGLAIPLAWTRKHIRSIFVGRTSLDFTDDDRETAELLRTRLATIVRALDEPARGTSITAPLDRPLTVLSPRRVAHAKPADQGVAHPRLTPRQREVIELLTLGLANKQIATELHISAGTVKKHLEGAFQALGAHNRVTAAQRYLQLQARTDMTA